MLTLVVNDSTLKTLNILLNLLLSIYMDKITIPWGENWIGQVGDGTTTDRHTPVLVGPIRHTITLHVGDHGTWGATAPDGWAFGTSKTYIIHDVAHGTVWSTITFPEPIGDSAWSFGSWDPAQPVTGNIKAAFTTTAQWNAPMGGGGGFPQPPDEYEYIYHEAYMFGNTAGEFRPRANTTRAEVAAILVRTMVEDFEYGTYPADAASLASFSDVTPANWFYWYIVWAYTEGLVLGYEDGTFRPNAPITRQEYAAMVARTGEVLEAGDLDYGDVDTISEWALNYVYTAFENGWMIGDQNDNFRPRANILRAEVATATNRILGRVDSNAALAAANLQNPGYAREFPDVADTAWYFASVLAAANDHRNRLCDDDGITWKEILVD